MYFNIFLYLLLDMHKYIFVILKSYINIVVLCNLVFVNIIINICNI